MAQRAARDRLQICYGLASILLAIVLVLVVGSLLAYFMYMGTSSKPAVSELARLRQTLFGLCLLFSGTPAGLLVLLGFANAAWVRFRYELSLRAIRAKAIQERRLDALAKCGETYNRGHATSHWETFCRRNPRFVVGYAIAATAGLALAVIGQLIL